MADPTPSTPAPSTRPTTTKPVTVDAYAILSYAAGLGGFAAAIGIVDPTDQHLKLLVASLSAVSFLSGLALRTFFHPTGTTPPQ